MRIPDEPLSAEEANARLAALRRHDLDWRSGRAFAYHYHVDEQVEAIARRASGDWLFENALDPTSFPSLLQLENEVVAMCIDHLRGDAECVGNFTTGGTESILLAMKAARDAFRIEHPGVVAQVVLPRTAHAAFHKGAHLLGMEPVVVEVDPVTFRAVPAALEAAITPRTALLVASASGYAHGVVDPVRELGALASARGLRLHVDACIGGFLLPFLRELGEPVPDFDLSVPGVTSISMDLHKYAYCPKGASVVLHRTAALRADQLTVVTDWSGYVLVNPGMVSSRSGGPMAAAWSVLHRVGRRRFRALAATLRDARDQVVAAVKELPGLRLLGEPEMCLLAIASEGSGPPGDAEAVEILQVGELLRQRGWHVQPQLTVTNSPRNLHLSLMPANAPHMEAFVSDLAACVEAARALPKAEVPAALRQLLAGVDLLTLSDEELRGLLSAAGLGAGRVPEDRTAINLLLDELPPAARGRVLRVFFNQLYGPAYDAPAAG